jgi:hypothetical protein
MKCMVRELYINKAVTEKGREIEKKKLSKKK